VLYGLAGFGLRSATTTDSAGKDVAVLELYSVDGRSWTASMQALLGPTHTLLSIDSRENY